MGWPTWRKATEQALYGPDGFFRRETPAAHFRTSAHAAPELVAAALLRLARASDLTTFVDVGAGGGEILAALDTLAPDLALIGVEVAGRPAGLPGRIEWWPALPERLDRVLLFANEWLDNVPVDVVEVDEHGAVRLVLVDPATGAETLGPPVGDADARWLARWWPLDVAEPGQRAEVGWPRDEAWAGVIRRIERGIAIAVDYSHSRDDRPWGGTLTGYRDGRLVRPVPDTSTDLTSHVALDACAAAGVGAGACETLLVRQREALKALGVDGSLPPLELANADPVGYLTALGRSSRAVELLSIQGLGGFGWLVQAVGINLPGLLPTR